MKNTNNENIVLVTSGVKRTIRQLSLLFMFLFVAMFSHAQTIDVTMDCDANVNIPVVSVDGTGHNIFELGTIKIQYDGLFGRWLIFQNGTMVFFQNSLSSPNPPSNLSWTAFGNNGCSSVTVLNVNLATEICNNGLDDDGDLFADCLDTDCASDTYCHDTDNDGLADVIDADDDGDGIPDVIELAGMSSTTQPACGGETNLDFSASSTLVSGVHLQQGAVYRFSNVSVGMDALVTIESLMNVTVDVIDQNVSNPSLFKPRTTMSFSNIGEKGYVEYKIQIVNSGGSTPVVVGALSINLNDIDGMNAVKEQVWTKNPNSYTVSNNTTLTMTREGGWLVATAAANDVPGSDSSHPETNYSVRYTSVSELMIRVGGVSISSIPNVNTRAASIEFGCVANYVSPITYVHDVDQDGIANSIDLDSDNDGLPDALELKCSLIDTILKWDNNGVPYFLNGSPGVNESQSFVAENGLNVDFNVDLSNSGSATNIKWRTNFLLGASFMNQFANFSNETETWSFDLEFQKDIKDLSFLVRDLDYTDAINVVGYYKGVKVIPLFIGEAPEIVTSNEADLSVTGWSSFGAGLTATDPRGQLTVKFHQVIDRITIVRATRPTFNGNPSVSTYEIGDFIGCIFDDLDSDNDGVDDYFDLDSDNDGIYDLIESGNVLQDANSDGQVDGIVGTNGLLDALETVSDNGVINYVPTDTDGNGIMDAFELDSDADGCNDVDEAGYPDPNSDGMLGGIPLAVGINGKVLFLP